MDGILKYSVLNPLAISFVPFKMRKTLSEDPKSYKMKDDDEIKLKVTNQNSSHSMIKFKTGVCLKNNLIPDILTSSTLNEILDSRHSSTKLLNEDIYFTEKCFDMVHSTYKMPSSNHWKISHVATFLKLLFETLLGAYSIHNRSNSCSLNWMGKDETNFLENDSQTDKQCTCPPMFGCIIPPDFFGNPFNLNSSCNKKRIHVCHYSLANEKEVSSNTTSVLRTQTDFKNSRETKLNVKYTSGIVGGRIKEDYQFVSRSSTRKAIKTEDNSENQIEFCFKSEEKLCNRSRENFIESEHFNLDDLEMDVEMPKDIPTIADDDVHQLLDEGIPIAVVKEVCPALKKLVEPPGIGLSFELPETTICNPPCSVWCDSLPQPVKDTYQKFIKSLPQVEDLCNFSKPENVQRHDSTLKASYKRSFSANDCCEQNYEDVFQSDPESARACLAKHPLSYKFNQHDSSVKEQKYMPLNENMYMINGNSSNTRFNNSMWGLFDGEDSLWQALPDCAQSFDQSERQNSHFRRDREIKRQMSWS